MSREPVQLKMSNPKENTILDLYKNDVGTQRGKASRTTSYSYNNRQPALIYF